ncbi:MAG: sulfatase-like hydrolase/transferase, partial [Acidobacteriota bacterium]
LANTTLLRPVSNALFSHQVRQRIECTFDLLAELDGRSEQPFYAFAHLITPHPPYLFGPEGEARADDAHDLANWRPRSGYVDQLRYVNRRLEETIDRILSDERPAVIILHGDHGSATSGSTEGDVGEVTEPTPLMRERTAILHALYLPEGCRDRLYPSITPVNSFRLLFSCHFGADLPLLDDKVYFSGYKRPYLLRDATDLFDPAPDVDPLPQDGPLPGKADAPAS